MTKKDIKKALECCVKHVYCKGCPYRGNQQCIGKTQQDALTLITEQEKEIERLRTTLGQCNTELNSALESLKIQCREIGKLRAEVKQAQIDVLDNVKDVLANQKHECLERNDSSGYNAICECEKYVDLLFKEVQNAEDKG